MVFLHESALIEDGVHIGDKSYVWHFSHLRKGASIGKQCMIGRNVFVDQGVKIGDYSRIQNNSCLYSAAEIGRYVFVGPGVILTNDRHPRVPGMFSSSRKLPWKPSKIIVSDGATLGAAVVCVAPLTIGSFAFLAAGAVVTSDCSAFGLYVGAPAKRIGWVCYCAKPLLPDPQNRSLFHCEDCELTYEQTEGMSLRVKRD